MDYVAERMAEDPQATFPKVFAAALGWFEARSGFPPELRFSGDSQIKLLVESARADAEAGSESVKRAPRFPVSLLMSLEVAVMDERVPRGLRVVAWARLIKAYGVLRTDDMQRIPPALASMGVTRSRH